MLTKLRYLTIPAILLAIIILTPNLMSDSMTLERLAPMKESTSLDSALYTSVPVAAHSMDVPRSATEQERLLESLLLDSPGNTKAALALASVKVALNKKVEADELILQFLAKNPASFRSVADFYASQNRVDIQIETLLNGAQRQKGSEKSGTIRNIIAIADQHLLENPPRKELYQQIIEAEPAKLSNYFSYVEFLKQSKDYATAETVLKATLKQFPKSDKSIQVRLAELYQLQGKTEEALTIYENQFTLAGDLSAFEAYKNILRSNDSLTSYSRGLRKKARTGSLTDKDFLHLFLLYRSEQDFRKAETLLTSWCNSIKPTESNSLINFTKAFQAIESNSNAGKYAYAAYLSASDATKKSEALSLLLSATSKELYSRSVCFQTVLMG
jgi:tetratricopeptide (TPR) repeat protein